MPLNDSLVDSVLSDDYRWAHDSRLSKNHPAIDRTEDISAVARGALGTAKKDGVQRLAKYLDVYESPADARLEHTPTLRFQPVGPVNLVPQAASSPKSDSYLLTSERRSNRATPSMTHRSTSPTPTTPSISWQKHSMRQPSLRSSESHLCENSLSQQSANRNSLGGVDGMSVVETNYKAAKLMQVEDSYWQAAEKERQKPLSSVGVVRTPPQPAQTHKKAKQSIIESSPITVDGLRVLSPKEYINLDSKQALSITELHSNPANSEIATQHESIDSASELCSTTSRPIQDRLLSMATAGDLTRRDSIESELSKVDSQAPSLQEAISRALKTVASDLPKLGSRSDAEKLRSAQAIAARYRQSMNVDQNGNDSLHTERDRTTTNRAHAIEIDGATQSLQQTLGDEVQRPEIVRLQSHDLENPKIAALITALVNIKEESSRQDEIIEGLAERAERAKVEEAVVTSNIEEAHERVRAMEEQLEQHKRQADQMSAELYRLQLANAQSVRVNSVDKTSSAPSIAQRTVPKTSVGLEPEESFVDKIQRWDSGIAPVPPTENMSSTVADALRRAQDLLNRPPGAITRGASVSRRVSYTNSTRSTTTKARRPATAGNESHMQAALNRAEVEITRLKSQQEHKTNPVEATARPLTADMMPDARDTSKRPQDKVYTRLQLAKVENIGRVELENVLKNILVQLDVPYNAVSTRIPEIATQLELDPNERDVLWHETVKLRMFAENVHTSLYDGKTIQGDIASSDCLHRMHCRIDRSQRALRKLGM